MAQQAAAIAKAEEAVEFAARAARSAGKAVQAANLALDAAWSSLEAVKAVAAQQARAPKATPVPAPPPKQPPHQLPHTLKHQQEKRQQEEAPVLASKRPRVIGARLTDSTASGSSAARPSTVEPVATPAARPSAIEPVAKPAARPSTVEPVAAPAARPSTIEPVAKPAAHLSTIEPMAKPAARPKPSMAPAAQSIRAPVAPVTPLIEIDTDAEDPCDETPCEEALRLGAADFWETSQGSPKDGGCGAQASGSGGP